MTNLLVEPPANISGKWRPYRGKPFTRVKRRSPLVVEYPHRGFRFVPEIQPSTSSGKTREASEKTILDILIDNGYDPLVEPYALKILRIGTANGQEGWFVPDFYVNGDDDDEGRKGIYIEVSMGEDLANKLHKIQFVGEKYGKLVVHVTRENIGSFIANPYLLVDLIAQARIEELFREEAIEVDPSDVSVVESHARLGTILEPRIKIEKARKPKKGTRADPRKVKKPSNRPSRNPERRAERRAVRKQARSMNQSIASLRREAKLKSPYTAKLERIASSPQSPFKEAVRKTKSSAGPQRIGDRRRNAITLSRAA